MRKPKQLQGEINYRLQDKIYVKLLKMKDELYSNLDYKLDATYRAIIRRDLTHYLSDEMTPRLRKDMDAKKDQSLFNRQ